MEIVPQFWLLSRKAQSRIFQRMNVPDILKKVLEGLDVSYEIQGTFHPRDYCVQYRETDFNFASRLMEEEGIYYFFKHSANGHTMVVANTPQSHPDVPGQSRVVFEEVEGGYRDDDRVHGWEKTQELRSGKHTLWDHCFELPHKHVEADKTILPNVQVGKVNHKLEVGGNARLEIYDYPGEYAQRFDGVDRGGGDQPAELQKIFQDNKRTVGIRMEEEAVPGLVIRGSSNCRHFMAGHKFTLERHFNADGQYVLTGVAHAIHQTGDYRSDQGGPFEYENTFTCIPMALPFRPLRTTPKPFVQGTQTAVVVGPAGEEIFPDKYSRVKVQFHWDREGKNDTNSSCWIRVATLWAGKQWGVIHIPRIGQEVIVAFEEGDPDRPIIVGSVYNADMMPPYKLPDNKTQSGVKSRSSKNGGPANFNEIRFEDKKGEEEVYMHAERDLTTKVERDESREVDRDRTTTIGRDDTLTVGRNRKATVAMNDEETIGMNQTNTVGISRSTTIGASDTLTAGATISVTAGGVVTITAPMISLNAPTVMLSGTLIVGTAIVSPMYSPGIGNLI
jgi:type VI secretion system secreted protein VgrG